MPREVMRSTSRARLALCAKVSGVQPVQWIDVTTMADSKRRFRRLLAGPLALFSASVT